MHKLTVVLFASLAVSNFNVQAMDDELQEKENKTVVVIKKKKSNKLAIFLGLVGLGLGIAALIVALRAKAQQQESLAGKSWRGLKGWFRKVDEESDKLYDEI